MVRGDGVDYLFGLARNRRLLEQIAAERQAAEAEHQQTGKPARRFKDFTYATLDSWSRSRRVIGKAEHLDKGANPRFAVTSLEECCARTLYEKVYCARGEMENRIKECQLDLFADLTSAATMAANQLSLWFSSFAYVLLSALRRLALPATELAQGTCGTIRSKLLKLGRGDGLGQAHRLGLPPPGRVRSGACPPAPSTCMSLGRNDCRGTARATCVRDDSLRSRPPSA